MTTHPLLDPLQPTKLGRDQLVSRAVLRFASAAELLSYDLALGAAVSAAVLVGGRLFELDPADLTTVADGVSVVVDAGGRRYKAVDLGSILSVEATTITMPPALDATTWGLAWIVPPAATGAWSGHSTDIAVSTARGWMFIPARVGRIVHDKTTDGPYVYRVTGLWVPGLGSPSTGTVKPDALEWPLGLVVQSRSIAAPPTGSTRAAYIVPSGATGDWMAHVGSIALGSGTAGWVYIQPREGSEVSVVDEARKVRFSASTWSAGADALSTIRRTADASAVTPAGGAYVYAAAAPQVTNTRADLSLTHAARAAGNIVKIRYQAIAIGDSTVTTPLTIALMIDGAAIATQWMPAVLVADKATTIGIDFLVSVADLASHLYTIRIGAGATTLSQRSLTLQEVSVQ